MMGCVFIGVAPFAHQGPRIIPTGGMTGMAMMSVLWYLLHVWGERKIQIIAP